MSVISLPMPLKLLGAFVAYLAAGWLGCQITHAHHFVGVGWPAIGVGAVLVLHWGRGIWPALVASCLVLRWIQGDGLDSQLLLFTSANLAETFIASAVLGWRCSWQRGFFAIQQLRRILLAGALAPLVSAPLYALGFDALPTDFDSLSRVFKISSILWMRSATGFFAVAPALLCWLKFPQSVLGPNRREGAIVVAVVAVLCVVVFTDWIAPATHPFWLALIPMAAVFWCAARCGIFLTTHLVLAVLAMATVAAVDDSNLFRDYAAGGLRSMTWLILDLFGISALNLAVVSSRLTSKNDEEKAARKRLELLVRHSPIAVVEWDLDFRVRVWNEKAAQVFGFSSEQALGALGPDLLVPESERVLVWERWHSFFGLDEANGSFSNHNITADGKIILCDWYGALVRDEQQQVCGVVCLVVNASEREQASLALQESEQRLRNIADVLPQMISYYDSELERRFFNEAYRSALGGLEQATPALLQDLVSPTKFEELLPHCQRVLKGETVRFIEKLLLADGKLHSVDRILLPDYSANGSVVGFFSVATDITEYLHAQDQRLALETQVLQTQKLESLGKLAGHLAHEFNNRLFGIIGHADIAMHDLPTDHVGFDAMNKVLLIGREASDLCRQMFVFSGHGSGDKSTVDCGAMVTEMRRLMEISLPKRMRLTTSIAQSLPAVRADEAQLRQALMNLLNNAAEASSGERCEVQIKVHPVRRGTLEFTESFLADDSPDLCLVAITVRDDGDGIAADVLPRIFDPFFTSRSGAKGLGLAGVIGIIHGHGGALFVQSELGSGTALSMYLPALQVPSESVSGFSAELAE